MRLEVTTVRESCDKSIASNAKARAPLPRPQKLLPALGAAHANRPAGVVATAQTGSRSLANYYAESPSVPISASGVHGKLTGRRAPAKWFAINRVGGPLRMLRTKCRDIG